MAQLLKTDKSTIYREIKRNVKKRSYSASYAQELSDERKECFGRLRKFTYETQIPGVNNFKCTGTKGDVY